MKRMIDFLRTQPMLSCILGLVIGVASIKILPAGTSLQEGVVRMLLTATMAFFLYFISDGMQQHQFTRADKKMQPTDIRFHTAARNIQRALNQLFIDRLSVYASPQAGLAV